MNLHNVKQKLDKVNRLFSYLEENQEITARVDHDAFLASIRSLYDACFDDAATETVVTKVVEPIVEKTKEVDNTNQVQAQEKQEVKKRPKLVFNTTTENVAKKEEPVVKKEEPTAVEQKVETPIVKKEEPVVKVETPVVKKDEPIAKVETPTERFNEEFEELFLFKEATDLSQKLSTAPIQDLNKALGLNEKFLYINELFGGDVAKFQSAIKALNDGNEFDDARAYMESELVEQHGWMKKEKKTLAKSFAKLVHRRYL